MARLTVLEGIADSHEYALHTIIYDCLHASLCVGGEVPTPHQLPFTAWDSPGMALADRLPLIVFAPTEAVTFFLRLSRSPASAVLTDLSLPSSA